MKKLLILFLLFTVPCFAESEIKDVSSDVVANTTYATGQLMGGKLSFPSTVKKGAGIIQSVTLYDLAQQNIAVDLVLFEANPSATAFTNNLAFDIADADMDEIIDTISITDYYDFSDNSMARRGNLAIPFKLDSGETLYGALVSRGAGTYATDDVVIFINIIQE